LNEDHNEPLTGDKNLL